MRQYRIASIPADGIGPEVISAGLEVLDAVAARDGSFTLVVDHYDWGSNWYRKHGEFHAGRRARLAAHRRRDLFRRGRRSRHPGPHHALGPAAADLPGPRPVRQRAPDPHPARHHLAAARRRARRPRLGDRAREQRGRICRPWRPRASRPARGGRHRDRDLHPPRRRADHALRLRHRPLAARASCSPSSPSRTRSATAWCSGTRSPAWCRTTIPT